MICPAPAEPICCVTQAALAGSMPAWAPLREGSRCDGPISFGASPPHVTTTALPSGSSGQRLAKAGQNGPRGENGPPPGMGVRNGNGALAIVFGHRPVELVSLRQWAIPAVACCPSGAKRIQKPRTWIRSGGNGQRTGESSLLWRPWTAGSPTRS